MSNQIQVYSAFPEFSKLDLDQFENQLDVCIRELKQQLDALSTLESTWEACIQPLLDKMTQLENLWSPLSHLSGVQNTESLRKVYDSCVVKISAFYTELNQHEGLYKQVLAIQNSPNFETLDRAKKTAIEHRLRDFTLSGIGLNGEEKKRFSEISNRLTELSNKISNNVMDSAAAWSMHLTDKNDLVGLSETFIHTSEENAIHEGKSGYLLKLDFPTYYDVIKNAQSSQLREAVTKGWLTRASDIGPGGDQFDNTSLINETLKLRHEQAQLVGFKHYADYSLASKMAGSADKVFDLLNGMKERCKQQGLLELQKVSDYALQADGIESLKLSDIMYYAERLKKEIFSFNDEDIKPYLPITQVLPGFFRVIEKLFSIQFEEVESFDQYHPDIKLLSLKRDGKIFAYCYLDLYAREQKRSGAWMDVARSRVRLADGHLQLPVAYLVCNFSKPTATKPSLLSHNDLTTLFHEFGHTLHHMLTEQDCLDVSGIMGVAWDAVELPSQLLENWCWEKEVLQDISAHVDTGEPLPEQLIEKMVQAKHFNTGLMYLRQLVFSTFDFKLHAEYDPQNPHDITAFYDQIVQEMDVRENPEYNRMPHSFTHIFAGGYAAGYYSYLWAEVLSADAYSLFEEEGIFNQSTSAALVTHILSKGGSEDVEVLFERFRGREPSIDALLRHNGIGVKAA